MNRPPSPLPVALACVLAVCAWVPLQGQGEPYAPVAKLPAGVENDPDMALAAMVLNHVQVPPRSQVPIPPYPGALVIQTTPAQTATSSGKEIELLPVVVLVTTDAVETVAAYVP